MERVGWGGETPPFALRLCRHDPPKITKKRKVMIISIFVSQCIDRITHCSPFIY